MRTYENPWQVLRTRKKIVILCEKHKVKNLIRMLQKEKWQDGQYKNWKMQTIANTPSSTDKGCVLLTIVILKELDFSDLLDF